MELDLDKEIDALLRNRSPVFSGGVELAEGHLDADEIAAFAENSLPDKTRGVYVRHLAECDRCRKLLAISIVPAIKEVPAAENISAPEAVSVPWYRRVFLMPNLAYVMGSLVLVFAAAVGFLVLNRSGGGLNSEVSQVESRPEYQDTKSGAAPAISSAETANTTANSSASQANAARSTANANSVLANSAERPMVAAPPAPLAKPTDNNVSIDSTLATNTAKANETQLNERQIQALPAQADKRDAAPQMQRNDEVVLRNQQAPPGAGQRPNAEADLSKDRQYENKAGSLAAPRAKKAEGPESDGRRTVNGKNFRSAQGVWYDAEYKGQTVVDIRRGSGEFRKLDSGLRSIANELSGVIVVMWKEKAYRIQ